MCFNSFTNWSIIFLFCFVLYHVAGESNVYTLGNIGSHRVVATKLPAVGNSRSAMIAAGSTTTRLLGNTKKKTN